MEICFSLDRPTFNKISYFEELNDGEEDGNIGKQYKGFRGGSYHSICNFKLPYQYCDISAF